MIIATRQAIRTSSPGDIILMPLVGLRRIRYEEIVVIAAFNLVREAMLLAGSDYSMQLDERTESYV